MLGPAVSRSSSLQAGISAAKCGRRCADSNALPIFSLSTQPAKPAPDHPPLRRHPRPIRADRTRNALRSSATHHAPSAVPSSGRPIQRAEPRDPNTRQSRYVAVPPDAAA